MIPETQGEKTIEMTGVWSEPVVGLLPEVGVFVRSDDQLAPCYREVAWFVVPFKIWGVLFLLKFFPEVHVCTPWAACGPQ